MLQHGLLVWFCEAKIIMRGELLWGVVVSQRCCVAGGLSLVLQGGGVSGVGGGVAHRCVGVVIMHWL